MKLQLVNTKILNVSLKRLEKNQVKRKNNFGLNVGNLFSADNPKAFAVVFKLTLYNPEYYLVVDAVHWFEAEKEITEEFKLSDFPSINAPAIAFPFLRAYVSNLTLQSGYRPAILPSLNFVTMAKKKKSKN
jgi:preprotein translocase subunit SecB